MTRLLGQDSTRRDPSTVGRLRPQTPLCYHFRARYRGHGLREETHISRHKLSLGAKLVAANTLIILLVAVVEVWTAQVSHIYHPRILIVWGVTGLTVTAVDFLLLRNYFRTLLKFRDTIEAIHSGLYSSIVVDADSDATFGGVVRSVRDVIHRLEDESLLHTMQLLNSIEGERQRIGRELHDQTSQTLATALINLKLADNALDSNTEDSRERLAAAKRLIEHSLEQIKICVYDLRPVMLDDFGLVPTLRWHIKTHLARTGLTIIDDFEDAAVRAPRNIETTLYRVAQEALANVVRHSQATRVFIRLETKPEYAVLEISDNGKGFDPKQTDRGGKTNAGGLGLHTIRERIKLVKGTLKIVSEAGMGTQINVVIPIHPPVPAH